MDERTREWVEVSDRRWRLVTRRQLLTAGAAGAAAASLLPYVNLRAWAQTRRLTILQWSHFIPAYDKWFDNEYTKQWGKQHDVEVVVDHITFAQIPARAAAEVAARSGHDLYQHI